ncbi:MAG: DUF4258 domain-containing protein [Cyclobacteriaceae bacterium]|jgi:hypothetical protein|nr:DUF4258 domain-containing protein [Cyclobacteriaceae bacterium]MDH4298205.1 DUF4258 domain-containing protein [Cyclobacteriaceae bacterium]MDH5247899.1 DUF4258 domain-containing protein [Cyclobacteriaceae bacterium]
MQKKKLIPYIILAVLFVIALGIRQYRSEEVSETGSPATNNTAPSTKKATESRRSNLDIFRDPEAEYFFTKHARCRMACRNITQKEVKEIVRKADVNYNKSDLDAAQGPKYAVEGYTARDRQHIRVIVAPKQRHLSIVTVIDLDKDWECPSCR